MRKFKVGDRVRIIHLEEDAMNEDAYVKCLGKTGEIVEDYGSGEWNIVMEHDRMGYLFTNMEMIKAEEQQTMLFKRSKK